MGHTNDVARYSPQRGPAWWTTWQGLLMAVAVAIAAFIASSVLLAMQFSRTFQGIQGGSAATWTWALPLAGSIALFGISFAVLLVLLMFVRLRWAVDQYVKGRMHDILSDLDLLAREQPPYRLGAPDIRHVPPDERSGSSSRTTPSGPAD